MFPGPPVATYSYRESAEIGSSGVTRFIAVSVKTFVLCLGASFGLMISLDNTRDMWLQQAQQCGLIDLDAMWWRVPLYLLCSASVLGQYRFPVRHYWRGLVVQLAAYEVQYQVQWYVLPTNDAVGVGCIIGCCGDP